MDEKPYPGALALAQLHEKYLRAFVAEWRLAKQSDLILPETDDPAYGSLEALLWHVLECASYYIAWTAHALVLSPLERPELPEAESIEADMDRLVEETLAVWRLPLAHLPDKKFYAGEHAARWGTLYCVDAMLEHAVMHPLRHAWQLQKLAGRADV